MRGAQRAAFHEMSLEMAAHGCLFGRQSNEVINCHDYIPAKQDDDGIALGGDETKHEDVLASTIVALGRRFSQGALGVKDDFLVLCSNEMVHYVRCRRVTARVAKPL